MITLEQLLGLVGPLDDSPGENTSRERFRDFLKDSLGSIGSVRDFMEACLRNKGPQYDRALQDLVNHSASLLGFDVEYGRYRGVTNDIGHDGLWRWKDFTFVVEVKTTDAYSIKTAPVLGYVDNLISQGKISDWDHALGLYVFGRTDSDLKQLANTINAEKRTHQLRIATVESILSIVELVLDSQITPDEAVTLLRPGGVFVEDTVRLLARIASRDENEVIIDPPEEAKAVHEAVTPLSKAKVKSDQVSSENGNRMFLLTPVANEEQATAKETISGLIQAGWYVFGNRTPGRKKLKPGDRICFYESGVGIVAHAEVASIPEQKAPPVKHLVKNLDKFPWAFRIKNAHIYFESPVVLDAQCRNQLEAFTGKDPLKNWAWFVQGTHEITEHDFEILTGTETVPS